MNAGDQKTRDRDAEEICRRFNLFPELARTLADLLADHVAMSKRKVILTGGGHLQGLTWKPLLIQERAQKVVAAAFDVEI